MGKRKEYALAADEAGRWLQRHRPQRPALHEGLGVQLELAKNIIAQLPEAEPEREEAAPSSAPPTSSPRSSAYSSPFKSEAIALLQKYKPRSRPLNADDDRQPQVRRRRSPRPTGDLDREYEMAIAILRVAIKQATATDAGSTR